MGQKLQDRKKVLEILGKILVWVPQPLISNWRPKSVGWMVWTGQLSEWRLLTDISSTFFLSCSFWPICSQWINYLLIKTWANFHNHSNISNFYWRFGLCSDEQNSINIINIIWKISTRDLNYFAMSIDWFINWWRRVLKPKWKIKFLLALTIIGNLKYNFTFLKNIPRKNNSGLSIA